MLRRTGTLLVGATLASLVASCGVNSRQFTVRSSENQPGQLGIQIGGEHIPAAGSLELPLGQPAKEPGTHPTEAEEEQRFKRRATWVAKHCPCLLEKTQTGPRMVSEAHP